MKKREEREESLQDSPLGREGVIASEFSSRYIETNPFRNNPFRILLSIEKEESL